MVLSQIGSGDMSVALDGGGAASAGEQRQDEAGPAGAEGGEDAEEECIPFAHLLAKFPKLVLVGLNGGGVAGDAAVAEMRHEILSDMGTDALLDVACVIGMFNGINRVADMCGIQIDALSAPFADGVLDVLKMDAGSNWSKAGRAKL
jgi:hypothetical protein